MKDVLRDVKGRLRVYPDDWRDGWNAGTRIFAPSTYICLASLLPALAFGLQLDHDTRGTLGVVQVLVSTSLTGLLQAVIGGQPLLIVGVAEPIVILYAMMFDFAERHEASGLGAARFLPWAAWVCCWAGALLALLAAAGACRAIRAFTRFSGELFGALIGVLFLQAAVKGLISQFRPDPTLHPHTPSSSPSSEPALDAAWLLVNGLWSTLLALGLCASALLTVTARSWPYGNRTARGLLADYGPPAMVVLWTGLSYAVTSARVAGGVPRRVSCGDVWAAGTVEWRVVRRMGEVPGGWVAAAAVPGAIIAVLFYFDHNVSSLLAQPPEYGLARPTAYHWDMALCAATTLLCGLLGLPPVNGVLPQAPMHTRSLARVRRRKPKGAAKEGGKARREAAAGGGLEAAEHPDADGCCNGLAPTGSGAVASTSTQRQQQQHHQLVQRRQPSQQDVQGGVDGASGAAGEGGGARGIAGAASCSGGEAPVPPGGREGAAAAGAQAEPKVVVGGLSRAEPHGRGAGRDAGAGGGLACPAAAAAGRGQAGGGERGGGVVVVDMRGDSHAAEDAGGTGGDTGGPCEPHCAAGAHGARGGLGEGDRPPLPGPELDPGPSPPPPQPPHGAAPCCRCRRGACSSCAGAAGPPRPAAAAGAGGAAPACTLQGGQDGQPGARPQRPGGAAVAAPAPSDPAAGPAGPDGYTAPAPDPGGGLGLVVLEQRLSGLLQSLGVAAALFAAPAIRTIPQACLWGYFGFMAVESQAGSSLAQRVGWLAADPPRRAALLAARPHPACCESVPAGALAAFTGLQLALLASLWALVTWAGPAGVAFPVAIMALVPARAYLLPRIFPPSALRDLDPAEYEPYEQAGPVPAGELAGVLAAAAPHTDPRVAAAEAALLLGQGSDAAQSLAAVVLDGADGGEQGGEGGGVHAHVRYGGDPELERSLIAAGHAGVHPIRHVGRGELRRRSAAAAAAAAGPGEPSDAGSRRRGVENGVTPGDGRGAQV